MITIMITDMVMITQDTHMRKMLNVLMNIKVMHMELMKNVQKPILVVMIMITPNLKNQLEETSMLTLHSFMLSEI